MTLKPMKMTRAKRSPGISLRTAILLGSFPLAIVVIVMVSLVQVYGIPFTGFEGSLSQKQDEAFSLLSRTADLESDYLQREINEKSRDVRSLADQAFVRDTVAGVARDFITTRGEQTVPAELMLKVQSNKALALLNSELSSYVSNFDTVRHLDIVDPLGRLIIASSDSSRIGHSNPVDDSGQQEMVISKERHTSIFSQDDGLNLTISQQLLAPGDNLEQSRVVGTLILALDLGAMTVHQVSEGRSSSSLETLLVNEDGIALTPLKFNPAPSMTHKITALPATLAASGHEGIIAATDYRGEPILAAFRFIRLSTYQGLGMVTKRDQKEVFASVYETIYYNLTFTAIAIFSLLGLIAILVSRLTAPISNLDQLVQRVKAGDLSVRGEIRGSREIRRFTATFNNMVERIEGWQSELNRQVAYRTRELESKRAEMERFTYHASHDLKSPLVTIKGFVGSLEEDALNGDRKRIATDIKYIYEAVAVMQELIEEILEFSRVGHIENPYQEFSISELAARTAELLSTSISQANVKVTIQPDLPLVYADRPRIREVIQNLLENAIKFMGDQADPWIEIGAREMNGETVFFVKDNGIGIAKPYLKKIFLLFERLDSETEGSGLGLAIAKRVIEKHGGKIWMESSGPGQGCCACFTLPRKEGDRG